MVYLLIVIAWMWVWGGAVFYAVCNNLEFLPGAHLRATRVIIGAILWPIALPIVALIYFAGELRDWLDAGN